MSLKVAIIGSGIAGIASAIRLAVKGHHVDLFEANAYPGGKLSEIQLGDYRFDAGPSLFTFPELVDELFVLAKENPRDYFNYERLEEICRYFYEDGTQFTAYGDRDRLIQELSTKTSEPAEHIKKALDNSAQLYDFLGEMFMFRSLHDIRTFIGKSAFRSYLNLGKMDFFRTMHAANEDQFNDARLVQLFDRYATYNGSDPYQTPATMNIIPNLEFGKGAFFPEGGMNAITRSLVALAERTGVTLHLGQKVERILLKNKRINGLRVGGEDLDYDRVVTNMDMVATYKKLLPDVSEPKRLLKQQKSSSAVIFYWGISKSFPELDLHNIFFSSDYKTEFKHLFQDMTLYDDPTVYVNISSKHRTEDAPSGGENWFTMINAPHNVGQDWEGLVAAARRSILTKLERMLGQPIEPLIEVEDVLDPRTIESRTSSSLGALYGNSSNNKFSAFLRHPNVSRRIKGLYFCGGSVHPGGGIPMALSSAKIVDKYFS